MEEAKEDELKLHSEEILVRLQNEVKGSSTRYYLEMKSDFCTWLF